MDAGLNVFVPPTKNAQINIVYEKNLNPVPTRLSHVIYCHGDKKYPTFFFLNDLFLYLAIELCQVFMNSWNRV